MKNEKVYFTRFTSNNCALTKEHSLTDRGKLHTKPSAHMSSGVVDTLHTDLLGLQDVIENLNQDQCLGLGVWEEGLLENDMSIALTTADKANGEDNIARSLKYLKFLDGHPALMYIDIDGTDLSMDQAFDLLVSVDPALNDTEMLVTFSSSAHIYKEDGTCLRGDGSMHFFFIVSDGSRMKEYGKLLFNRLIMKGKGFTHIDKSGKIWVKTPIDNSVWSPEREVFEAVPITKNGLVSKKNDYIAHQEGSMLDIDASIDSLKMTKDNELQLKLMMADLRKGSRAEALETQESHRKRLARARAEKNDTKVGDELRALNNRSTVYDDDHRPIIKVQASDWILLEDGSSIQVREILEDPDPWHGTTVPDIDEPYYGGDLRNKIPGKQKAKIFVNYSDSNQCEVIVNSNAHGGILYKLVWDYDQLMNFMSSASVDELIETWQTFMDGGYSNMALTAGQLDDIAVLFKDRLGPASVGVSTTKSDVIKDLKQVTTSKRKQRLQEKSLDLEEELLRLNKKYAVVGIGNTCRVYTEEYKPDIKKWYAIPKDKTALTQLYANKLFEFQKGNSVTEENIFSIWFEWEHRNTFHYSGMYPNANRFRGCSDGAVLQQQNKEFDTFNTWQGYLGNIENATNCDMIINHIREVWCSNDEEAFQYVIKWIAHIFQKPEERCQTALVFKGEQGSGKNIIIDDLLGKLLGCHYTITSKSAPVVGRFNSAIANCVLVFMNEALWSGNKEAAGVVKSQTTDGEILVEKKGIEVEAMRNYARYIYASNNDWVTGAEHGDRRFYYAPVSSHKKDDHDYFDELMESIDNGGKESFLDYVLNHVDLTGYRTGKMPTNSGDQKLFDMLQTEQPSLSFMHALLLDPEDMLEDFPNLASWLHDPLLISKTQLWEYFQAYCDDAKIKRAYTPKALFYKQLSGYKMISNNARYGHHVGASRKVGGIYSIEFRPLAEARRTFEKSVNIPVNWEDEDDEENEEKT